MTEADFQHDATGHEVISFLVNEHEFCVNIQNIREIRGWIPATPLPHSPDYILGVINLRGVIVPIIDLSARLGMATSEPGKSHVIMVTKMGENTYGILVSMVLDIVQISSEQLRDVPEVNSSVVKNSFKNVIAMEDRIISEIIFESIVPEAEAA